MVILINTTNKPFKVQYKNGGKLFVKKIPSNKVVGMKGLIVSDQISNKEFLAKKNITIYDYDRGTYYHSNSSSSTLLNSLPLLFVGAGANQAVSAGYSGSTSISAMTFTIQNVSSPTVYGITTSANTKMSNGTISATTIENNTYVSFSGANTTVQNVYAALTGSTFSGYGITITKGTALQMETKIDTGSTVTSYLSASTSEAASAFVFMNAMV